MPTHKQRRRRQKSRRHEYEYVYVDDEGREVEVDPAEVKPGKKPEATAPTRGGRPVEPPSWKRVGRRTLLFSPLFFLAVTLLYRGLEVTEQIVLTLQLMLMFLVFSYLMERMTFRRFERRR